MRDTVLIVTEPADAHADEVIRHLVARGVAVFRLHTEDFPTRVGISISIDGDGADGGLVTEHRSVGLNEIGAVWFRRPTPPALDPELRESAREFADRQARLTLTALYSVLEDRFWVCRLPNLRRAEIKAKQLEAALSVGLSIPPTLITNDPDSVRKFRDHIWPDELLVKPIQGMPIVDDEHRFPLATVVPRDHSLESVSLAPSIYQRLVRKVADLRCVVIGTHVFAAQVRSRHVDWRRADEQWTEFALPQEFANRLIALTEHFGIHFASIDACITDTDDLVFLELNPNGQWLWLELDVGFPLARTIANLLEESMAQHPVKSKA